MVVTKKLSVRSRVQFAGVFAAALALYLLGSPEESHAFESVKFAIKEICGHMQGNLGALLMTTAGVGAIVSAAFGNFKASYSFIVTGIGAFAVSQTLKLYFPAAGALCEQGGQGNGRVISHDIPAVPSNQAARQKFLDFTVDLSKGAQLDLSDPDERDDSTDEPAAESSGGGDEETAPGNEANVRDLMDEF